jgi:hypothetical protein
MEPTVNGSADAWRERIAAQRASGNSIRGWCRENNHHEHAFYWWRSRLGLSPGSAAKRRQRLVAKPHPQAGARFSEVIVNRVEPMCLRLTGGRELILPASMPAESIAKLVHAIEGAA